MRVQSGGGNAIQFLQAQQAFQARKPAAQPQQPQFELPEAAPAQNEPLPANVGAAFDRIPQWRQTVSEVTQIARQAGYVGLSESDIQRAYVNGESLLADYRV